MVSGVECGETGRSHWLEITRVGVGVTDSCLLLQHFHIYNSELTKNRPLKNTNTGRESILVDPANSSRDKSVSSLPVSSSPSELPSNLADTWRLSPSKGDRKYKTSGKFYNNFAALAFISI
jgi:hypothetical protein